MPLQFSFAAPGGAGTLGTYESIYDQIEGITGFDALFVADNATPGEWGAVRGTGVLSQGNVTRHPTISERDGLAVVDFNETGVLGLSGLTIGSVTAYTVGIRYFMKSHTTDTQNLFGHDLTSPFARVLHRYTTSNAYLRFDGAADFDVEVPEANQWNSLILTQGGGTTRMSVNDGPFGSASNANLNLASFSVGNSRDTSGDAIIDVRSVILIGSDVSGNSNLDVVRAALNSL